MGTCATPHVESAEAWEPRRASIAWQPNAQAIDAAMNANPRRPTNETRFELGAAVRGAGSLLSQAARQTGRTRRP